MNSSDQGNRRQYWEALHGPRAFWLENERYDWGDNMGQSKLNKSWLSVPGGHSTGADTNDILATVDYRSTEFDIGQIDDHLGNRRVRQGCCRKPAGTCEFTAERIIRERMTVSDTETLAHRLFGELKPLVAAVREFWLWSAVAVMVKLTHWRSWPKQRLSALGPQRD